MLDFDVKKSFGDFTLQVAERVEREWLVLLAPSGAGKSLLLNLISGLVRPEAGHVRLAGETLFDQARRIDRPIRARRIGYLFQDFALFPHLTVAENIAFGLPRGRDAGAAVVHWVRLFQLQGREGAYPGELSGGQQQRVALARTLASEPQVLLLDEPFSSLDRRIRELLYREVQGLKAGLDLPVILVTHDFVEAQLLGDRVAVLENGRVLESGAKASIFDHPRRHETARFLGVDNVLPVTLLPEKAGAPLEVALGGLTLTVERERPVPSGGPVYLCIHAADVRLLLDKGPRPNSVPATILRIQPQAGTNRVTVGARLPDGSDGPELETLVDDYVLGRHDILPGAQVTLWLPGDKLFLTA